MHQINYPFIFEIDQTYRLNHHQLYKVALSLSVCWCATLTLQLADYKLNEQPTSSAVYSIGLLLIFAFFFLNPCDFIYKTVRVQILKTLEQIIIAPFGLVRFRHFFLTDILCSLVSVLQ